MNGRLALWLAVTLGVLSLDANSAEPDVYATAARGSWKALGATLDRQAAGAGWKHYLRWHELDPVIDAGGLPDPNLLGDVVLRLDRRAPGLERPEFERVRRDLDNWLVSIIATQWGDLPAAIRGQAESVRLEPARLAAAHQSFRLAVSRLASALGRSSRGQAWAASLRLPELQQAAAGQGPVDAATLRGFHDRFTGSTAGLEWEGFAEIRAVLDRYAGLAETLAAPDAEQLKSQKIAALADAVAALGPAPEGPARGAVEENLIWLARSEAAPAVVRAVRWRYGQPNLRVRLSPGFLRQAVARPVDQVAPIREFILGTNIRGTGRTVGAVSFNVVPSSTDWRGCVQLDATSYGRTIGKNGPATIYGRSTTQLCAEKLVTIDEEGVRVSPTTATAKANPKTDSIDVDVPRIVRRLATRVAWRRVGESRGQAAAIASGIARRRISEQFDAQFAGPVAEGNAKLEENLLDPLARVDATPELDFDSGAAGWTLAAFQGRGGGLGASNRPPVIDAPVAFQLHETFVQRFGGVYAGQTLSNDQVKGRALNTFGKLPKNWSKPVEGEEEDVPGSVTFDDVDPINVAFRDGRMSIILRSKQFTRGERVVSNPMVITAAYRVSTDGPLLVFRREELLAMPADAQPGEKLPLSATLNKNLVEKGFRKVFREEITLDPHDLMEDPDKFGDAAFAPVVCDDGWMNVGVVFSNVRG